MSFLGDSRLNRAYFLLATGGASLEQTRLLLVCQLMLLQEHIGKVIDTSDAFVVASTSLNLNLLRGFNWTSSFGNFLGSSA